MVPGASLGRFTIVEPIGTGGMGVVYKAVDPELGRTVAIKVLHEDARSEGKARLLREAQAMARLAHPNVVPVHEIGSGDPSFIVMEHVAGGTVRQWLAEPRSVDAIVEVFEQAGRGLAAAHDAGLVHRDFKPENCLRGTDGRVRVVDFGLVATRERTQELDVPASTSLDVALTHTGICLGTPAYMAPEQHKGENTDARSDQFSFAVAFYEALYGERPFAGSKYRELVRNVYAGTIRPAPESSRVSPALRDVIVRALAVDPAARFPSMTAFLDAARKTTMTPVVEPVVAAPVRAPRRLPIAIAAVVVIVVAVGVGIAATSSSSSPSSSPSSSSSSTASSPAPAPGPAPAPSQPEPTLPVVVAPPSSVTPAPPARPPTRPTRPAPAAAPAGSATPPPATGSAVDDAADRRRRQLELKE